MLRDTDRAHVSGVILAGGRGRRLGGIDKGLMELHGKPLVMHVAADIAPQVRDLAVSANRNHAEYRRLGFRVIADVLQDYQGPLAGIASAMRFLENKWLMFLPCDAPNPAFDIVERLFRGASDAKADIAVAHDGNRIQPVHVLVRRSLLPDLERFLGRGERKTGCWYAGHRTAVVDFSDRRKSFANINTAAEQAVWVAE